MIDRRNAVREGIKNSLTLRSEPDFLRRGIIDVGCESRDLFAILRILGVTYTLCEAR